MKNVPNILTALRMSCSLFFAFFFLRAQYTGCILVFAFSMLSDVLDGAIARRFNCESNLGKILDPLADKLMLIAVSICFYIRALIPLYMFLAIIIKEGVMLLGGVIMLRSNVVAYSDVYGKAATTIFSCSIAACLLQMYPAFAFLGSLYLFLFGISIVCSFIALVHYGRTQFAKRADQ